MRKIRSAPQAKRQHGRSPFRWFGCYPWPRTKKLTVVLTYRGGAEGYVLVESRGRSGIFHGSAEILAVLMEVMQTG